MYVLDEPSIGLHQRDNDRLIGTLKHLRDIGNSVLVVEHDEDMIRAADHVIDMGPGAGVHGGRVMAQGSFDDIRADPVSLTGHARAAHRVPGKPPWHVPQRRPGRASRLPLQGERHASCRHQREPQVLRVVNATGNNLQGRERRRARRPAHLRDRRLRIGQVHPGQRHACTPRAAQKIHRAHVEPAAHEEILGLEYFDKVINVDQSPIGRTPRSNPATYTGCSHPSAS
jgi:excinuclease ABC subunit A